MELAATDSYGKQPISLNVDKRFGKVIINDIEMSCPEKLILKEKFPLRLVFFNGGRLAANETRIINHLSGLQDGEPAPLPTPRKMDDKLFYSVNYSRKKHVNSIFKVESTSAALEFSMINLQDKYGDGAIMDSRRRNAAGAAQGKTSAIPDYFR